jgi:hypothetical protein
MTYSNIILTSNVNIIKNLSDFLSSLTLIDVIFFFSIILLMVLVTVLLYFIKVNEDVVEVEEETNDNTPKTEEVLNITKEYTDEPKEEVSYYDDEEGELIDLKSISEALDNGEKNIELTKFEEEQEKDAIISYDELLRKTQNTGINYKNEVMMDDLSVKEVDLENFINENKKEINDTVTKPNVQVISYYQEEAFLESLKKLEQQLN